MPGAHGGWGARKMHVHIHINAGTHTYPQTYTETRERPEFNGRAVLCMWGPWVWFLAPNQSKPTGSALPESSAHTWNQPVVEVSSEEPGLTAHAAPHLQSQLRGVGGRSIEIQVSTAPLKVLGQPKLHKKDLISQLNKNQNQNQGANHQGTVDNGNSLVARRKKMIFKEFYISTQRAINSHYSDHWGRYTMALHILMT